MGFLQRKAFEFFEIFYDEVTGLIADVALPGSPSSIAATGFGISCYPIAVRHGWWTRGEAARRTLTLLRFLAGSSQRGDRVASGYRGFYYHFLDMRTGRREWGSEVSIIDTALLFCGILTASAFFDGTDATEREIRKLASDLYDRVEWNWALDEGLCLRLGWLPESGFPSHRWRGYDEALPLYLLALGSSSHPIRQDSYLAWGETFSWFGSGDDALLHAGPLFIHLFPQAWLDLREVEDPLIGARDTDYFRNTQRAIARQIEYAKNNPQGFPGYSQDIWGLTAMDGPRRKAKLRGKFVTFHGYLARGVPCGPDDGTLAPWASMACLPFAPIESARSLKHLLKHYGDVLIDGRFPEAFNPTLHRRRGVGRWRSDRVLGIDQGLVVMMAENFSSEFVWNLTKRVVPFRRGMEIAGLKGGWLSNVAEVGAESNTSDQDLAIEA